MPTADELLNATAVRGLITCLSTALPGQPLKTVRAAVKEFPGLALRERSDLVRDALLADLPTDFAEFTKVIQQALTQPGFTGWMIWPVTSAVSARAIEDGTKQAFDDALGLLAELTPRLTAEFGIRPLLDADLNRALPIVLTWTKHPDENVRRLASEGTRPLLPWARRVRAILADPRSTVPILDALYQDESAYVRRSVANHLNDLSRADPALVVEVAQRWLADAQPETGQLVRHALRTLVKKGYPTALALLGFHPPTGVSVAGPELTLTTVAVGGELEFSCTVSNGGSEPARLAIDYVIHHQKANGSQAPKVFKLAARTLAPGDTITLTRKHSFKVITTRAYHPGEHLIEVQVNGTTFGRTAFMLVKDAAGG
ncbi:MAG TPA: DNA alkylation repair protein [Pseudonocardiaceae bacterium]|nr:DNA alkylation repair protein [Pseudonocardiaceae bacterium]